MVNLRLWSENNPFTSKSQTSIFHYIRGDPRGDNLGKIVNSSRTGNYLEQSLQKKRQTSFWEVLMGASGHGRKRWLLLLSTVSSFGHGTSRTKQVTGERGHRNDKEVIFAKLWGKHDVSGSVYAKWRETQKWTRHSSFSMSQTVMKRMTISYSLRPLQGG